MSLLLAPSLLLCTHTNTHTHTHLHTHTHAHTHTNTHTHTVQHTAQRNTHARTQYNPAWMRIPIHRLSHHIYLHTALPNNCTLCLHGGDVAWQVTVASLKRLGKEILARKCVDSRRDTLVLLYCRIFYYLIITMSLTDPAAGPLYHSKTLLNDCFIPGFCSPFVLKIWLLN